MLFKAVLKKCSALLAAMLIMAAAWWLLHLPGASMQMITFAFLSAAALCNIPQAKIRIQRCIQMVCCAAAAQFLIGITADHQFTRIIISAVISFYTLTLIKNRQSAVIILLITYLSFLSPPGFSDSLDRSVDIVFSGITVIAVTALGNIFVSDIRSETANGKPYTSRQAAVFTAELTVGTIIFELAKHEQSAWIMLTILFIHMAETPRLKIPVLVKQRIAATIPGILLGGIYLAGFGNSDYRAIYIVPVTGTLSFFMLYLKNDYFIFTLLFMFTLTVFTDWTLGTCHRFHFNDILFVRSLAAITGGVLLLCGKNMIQKESAA